MLNIECIVHKRKVFTQFGQGNKYVLHEQKNINEQINAALFCKLDNKAANTAGLRF